jgi:recombination protein RecA
MNVASRLRTQIEAALADRIPSALTPAVRTVREVAPTGIAALDEALQGGFSVGALTELVGVECSGRTGLALSLAAQATQAERVCAWVDVSNALCPESAAAAGVDLRRLLWVRCGVPAVDSEPASTSAQGNFTLPERYMVAPAAKRGLHGGGFGPHPRTESKGLADGVNDLLGVGAMGPRCAESQQRMVRVERERFEAPPIQPRARCAEAMGSTRGWSRIEQGLRATDLLLQAGGFGALVLDLGGIAPEHVSRIPLATWFRYAAAAERSRTSVVLLTQHACSKSSAGVVLRLHAEAQEMHRLSESTVLDGLACTAEVLRQRFVDAAPRVVPLHKPPQRESAMWRSKAPWTGGQ